MQEFLPKQELLSHLRRAFFYAENGLKNLFFRQKDELVMIKC